MTTKSDIPFLTEIQAHIRCSKKPLIVVLGHTASGKTAYSVDLAERLNAQFTMHNSQFQGCEIINADSRQLYKYMDIGTAKITEEEKRGVVHHLLDVVDPHEPITTAWYKERAEKVIEDCHARNVVPIMVGGSMLYISAVIDGLLPLPPADASLRQSLTEELEQSGHDALYERLKELDPEAAARIDPRNHVYLIRALELAESGLPPSTSKKTSPCPYDLFLIGLALPQEERGERIAKRTRQLFEAGWIAEVQSLLDRGYTANDPGFMSHGYREIAIALLAHHGKIPSDAVETLITETSSKAKQYAKRQMTWWRGDPRIHWIDV